VWDMRICEGVLEGTGLYTPQVVKVVDTEMWGGEIGNADHEIRSCTCSWTAAVGE